MRISSQVMSKRAPMGETNTLPSCTDPSQNIELRTIVERFVKGLPIPAVGHVLTPDDYDAEDNDYCPPSALDLSEVKDMVDAAQAKYDDIVREASKPQPVSSVTAPSVSPSSPPESDGEGS